MPDTVDDDPADEPVTGADSGDPGVPVWTTSTCSPGSGHQQETGRPSAPRRRQHRPQRPPVRGEVAGGQERAGRDGGGGPLSLDHRGIRDRNVVHSVGHRHVRLAQIGRGDRLSLCQGSIDHEGCRPMPCRGVQSGEHRDAGADHHEGADSGKGTSVTCACRRRRSHGPGASRIAGASGAGSGPSSGDAAADPFRHRGHSRPRSMPADRREVRRHGIETLDLDNPQAGVPVV